MFRSIVSVLVAALIGLFAVSADARTKLSNKVYKSPTTAAINNAAYLIIRAQSSGNPAAATIGQKLSFVPQSQNAPKYLKLGPTSSSPSGMTQRITVQTRRSVNGVRGGTPLAEMTLSVRPVRQAGKLIGYRAYNRAAPQNKININR